MYFYIVAQLSSLVPTDSPAKTILLRCTSISLPSFTSSSSSLGTLSTNISPVETLLSSTSCRSTLSPPSLTIEIPDFFTDKELQVSTPLVEDLLSSLDDGVLKVTHLHSLFLGKYKYIASNQILMTLLNLCDSRVSMCREKDEYYEWQNTSRSSLHYAFEYRTKRDNILDGYPCHIRGFI